MEAGEGRGWGGECVAVGEVAIRVVLGEKAGEAECWEERWRSVGEKEDEQNGGS